MSNHHTDSGIMDGVIDGAEAFVDKAADKGEDKLAHARDELESDLAAARLHLGHLEAGLKRKAINVDDYVHANPWQAIGVAMGAGVVAGVLTGAMAFRR